MRSWAAALLLASAATLAGCGEEGEDHAVTPNDEWVHAISFIRIQAGKKRPDGQARALAYQVFRRLQEGTPFEELARVHSEDPSAADGGFFDFVSIAHDTSFAGAVQALAPGQTSHPVRTELGYLILRRHPYEEAKALEKKYVYPVYGFYLPWEGLPGGDGRTKEQTAALATDIVKQLRAGTLTLLQAVDLYRPKLPGLPVDAFLMSEPRRESNKGMVDAVKDLPVGGFADPVETSSGYAILMRGKQLRAMVRYLLVQHIESQDRNLRVRRTRAEAHAHAQKALAELLPDKSNWDEVYKKYADVMPMTDARGTYGTVGNGDAPPEVEQALMATSPGEVYPEVVESATGFYIIWRLD